MTKLGSTLFVLLSLLIFGCGGGGGGSNSGPGRGLGDSCPIGSGPGMVVYSTVWGGSTPLDASQVFQLIDADGNVVRTDAVNRLSQSTTDLEIVGISPGVYEFKATLYSQANATGSILGVTSQVLDLCGEIATVKTTANSNVVKVQVSPGSYNMIQQQTQRFVATALSSSNEAVFVDEGSITWSVLGGIGSIDTDGLFSALVAGQGSVRATLASPSLNAAAVVEVEEFVISQTKWTVFVFLNAANDLYSWSDDNVNQMEEVANNPDVRFVVQWKQSRDLFAGSTFDGVRRYLVKPDNTESLVSELLQSDLVDNQGVALDMGRPETLKDFLDWGTTFYPADRYALVLWNHGNGWLRDGDDDGRAFSYDDQTGSSIQIWEIDQALNGHDLDIVAWDTSLMQMMEVAYELAPYTKFVVGSEESPPAQGYPYQDVFAPMRDNPNDTTANITKGFVDGMLNDPRYVNRKITQSSIDTSKLPALALSLDTLGSLLSANADTLSHVDLENEFADLVWTTRGYSNLANVHDGNSGTSTSTGSAINQDHLTVIWPVLRYVDRVEILGALGIDDDTELQYTTDGALWQLVTTGLGDGDGEYAVARMALGVRVLNTNLNPKPVSIAEIRVYDNVIERVRSNSKAYSQSSSRYYRDIVNLCEFFEADQFTPANVVNACADLRAKVADAVVWEGHNNQSLNSNGLSIDFSPGDVFAVRRTDYIQLRFSIDTLWDDWLTIAP